MALNDDTSARNESRAIAEGGRRLTAVLGPTNTGKTHLAVERMLGHASGMIGLPLRLLAREVYDRVVAKVGPDAAALITGEEKIVPAQPRYFVCTVESMPLERPVAFMAIDEIQLAADLDRGHIFTDRLLRARGLEETMFLGADTMRPLIRQLLPDVHFITRTRFSDLSYTGPKKLSRLPRRSAIVAFSVESVYGIAELVRRQRGGAAVVMGALSPRTRNAQVALYQSGDVDFLVATDAIGMGLNMDVDHVAFAGTSKFDGVGIRDLRANEIAQIAGRAGRYMNDGTFGPTGDVPPFDPQIVEQIEQHRFDPVRILQWRNPGLDFSSIDALIQSLEQVPPAKGLARARAADDLAALRALSEDRDVLARATSRSALEQLWQVCQVPDFRKATLDEHVRMLHQIFVHLTDNNGVLPPDWVSGHVERIAVTSGDVDTLSQRLAQVRTWTYISHRAGWLEDQAYWQERTRVIEDQLSDALHEALTQRFIDRRTSVLMKRLQATDELSSSVDDEGEVQIEGEYVGRLNGFIFVADPRGAATQLGPRTLRQAAQRALGPEIAQRAMRIVHAQPDAIQLSEHAKLWWEGWPVARLVAGANALTPRVELLADDLLSGVLRENVQAHLEGWIKAHVGRVLQPLVALSAAQDLEGMARGLAFQLVETMGSLPRQDAAESVRALDQAGRASLRQYGVRFGAHSIFIPLLMKPQPTALKVLLWAIAEDSGGKGLRVPGPPAPSLVSIPVESGVPRLYYERAGFRVLGQRAVRLDMLERLADMLRPPRPVAAVEPVKPGAGVPPAAGFAEGETVPVGESPPVEGEVASQPAVGESNEAAHSAAPEITPPPASPPVHGTPPGDGGIAISADMMSIVGCSGAEFEALLRAMGYRAQTRTAEDGTTSQVWRLAPRRPDGQRGKRKPQRGAQPSRGEKPEAAAADEKGSRPARSGKKMQGRRGRPKDDPKGQPHAPREKDHRAGRSAQDDKPRREDRRAREERYDPTSPFAALAVLKQSMKAGKGG